MARNPIVYAAQILLVLSSTVSVMAQPNTRDSVDPGSIDVRAPEEIKRGSGTWSAERMRKAKPMEAPTRRAPSDEKAPKDGKD